MRTVWSYIKFNKMLGLTLIHTFWHADGIPERFFFEKLDFEKKSVNDKKAFRQRVEQCPYAGLQIRVCIGIFFLYFSSKTYNVGTQKNCLNEIVLLSTQNTCLNWLIRELLQFYAYKISLSRSNLLLMTGSGSKSHSDLKNKSPMVVLEGLPEFLALEALLLSIVIWGIVS